MFVAFFVKVKILEVITSILYLQMDLTNFSWVEAINVIEMAKQISEKESKFWLFPPL